jgi:uracil-xanthine permease
MGDGDVVAPGQRLNWLLTVAFGLQHLMVMFGATMLVPMLTGFPPTTTLLFSGIGTLLFLLITRNRVPSYLGSSFAFVAPLGAAASQGIGLDGQLGAVLLAGLMLTAVGVAVKALGARLLEWLMPPVVTGGVVMLVGLNLAPSATAAFNKQGAIGAVTLLSTFVAAVFVRGLASRVCVLVGVLIGWAAAAVGGLLDPARLTEVSVAPWVGLPTFATPEIRPSVVLLVLPVVIVLVAENVGHVKAVGAITGRDLDGSMGDALIGNGLATTLAGLGGGSGTTTYAENIGVMAATKVYSTAAHAIAAFTVVLLSFSPKFGALVNTVPVGVIGGVTLMLYGLIVLVGVRIWIDSRVQFNDPISLLVVAAALVAGAGNLTLAVGGMQFGGIAWGSLLIVFVHPVLRRLQEWHRGRQ